MSDQLQRTICETIGFVPPGEVTEPQVRESTQHERFVSQLITYRASDGDTITAFLLIPNASDFGPGPHPGVVALHQHNSQWEIGKSEICGISGDPLQAFGPALARRGICVLAPDAVGFESRCRRAGAGREVAPPLSRPGSNREGWLQYYNQMCYRIVAGDNLMRKVLTDACTAVGVLSGRQEVDPDQIGVVGHSFGGLGALYLAALDSRVGFSCVSGAACTYRTKMQRGTGLEMSLVIPGCVNVFDVDDLVRCVAPRRTLIVSSDEDPYSEDAHEIVESALVTFEQHGCADHLSHFHGKGTHALDQTRFDAMVDWLCRESGRSASH